MDIPSLNTRPGRVVDAEILRRFGSSVNALSQSKAKPFYLVLSVGRCKFRLVPSLVEHLLHAVLGGFPRAFDVVQLSDRVFRFSVASSLVGFHIYNLKFLSVWTSRSSSIFGTMAVPIIRLKIVTGAMRKKLNGRILLSVKRCVSPVQTQYQFLAFVFPKAPNPWRFQISNAALILLVILEYRMFNERIPSMALEKMTLPSMAFYFLNLLVFLLWPFIFSRAIEGILSMLILCI